MTILPLLPPYLERRRIAKKLLFATRRVSKKGVLKRAKPLLPTNMVAVLLTALTFQAHFSRIPQYLSRKQHPSPSTVMGYHSNCLAGDPSFM